jgi:hypothetical protein
MSKKIFISFFYLCVITSCNNNKNNVSSFDSENTSIVLNTIQNKTNANSGKKEVIRVNDLIINILEYNIINNDTIGFKVFYIIDSLSGKTIFNSKSREFRQVFEIPNEDPVEIRIFPNYILKKEKPLIIELRFVVSEILEYSKYTDSIQLSPNTLFPKVLQYLFADFEFLNNSFPFYQYFFINTNEKSVKAKLIPIPYSDIINKDSIHFLYELLKVDLSNEYRQCEKKEVLSKKIFTYSLTNSFSTSFDSILYSLYIPFECSESKNPIFAHYFYQFIE